MTREGVFISGFWLLRCIHMHPWHDGYSRCFWKPNTIYVSKKKQQHAHETAMITNNEDELVSNWHCLAFLIHTWWDVVLWWNTVGRTLSVPLELRTTLWIFFLSQTSQDTNIETNPSTLLQCLKVKTINTNVPSPTHTHTLPVRSGPPACHWP